MTLVNHPKSICLLASRIVSRVIINLRAFSHRYPCMCAVQRGSKRRAKPPIPRHAQAARESSQPRAMQGQQRSPSPEADWSRSPSRSKSKSQPRSPQPEWMERTAVRLDAGAVAAQKAVQTGGDDLKALYVMSPVAVVKAASSQPPQTPLSESAEFKAASSSQLRSHVETSYELHRLTGGGYKLPELRAGPFATALNPNRHVMMIQGRPVAVLSHLKHIYMSFQPCACHPTSEGGNQSLRAYRKTWGLEIQGVPRGTEEHGVAPRSTGMRGMARKSTRQHAEAPRSTQHTDPPTH